MKTQEYIRKREDDPEYFDNLSLKTLFKQRIIEIKDRRKTKKNRKKAAKQVSFWIYIYFINLMIYFELILNHILIIKLIIKKIYYIIFINFYRNKIKRIVQHLLKLDKNLLILEFNQIKYIFIFIIYIYLFIN